MRISDWSSDVCSSDLYLVGFEAERFPFLDHGVTLRTRDKVNKLGKISHAASVMTLVESLAVALTPDFAPVPRRAASDMVLNRHGQIGRASCRERGCQYV